MLVESNERAFGLFQKNVYTSGKHNFKSYFWNGSPILTLLFPLPSYLNAFRGPCGVANIGRLSMRVDACEGERSGGGRSFVNSYSVRLSVCLVLLIILTDPVYFCSDVFFSIF